MCKKEYNWFVICKLFNCVIVIVLRRCQNLKHRTLRRMVDLGLELCLKFVLLRVFLVSSNRV